MRLLFVPDRDRSSPVARLRAHAIAGELARRGHYALVASNYVPTRASVPRRGIGVVRTLASTASALRSLRYGDVLYLVRIQDVPGLSGLAIRAARRVGARIVYDFDDAVQLTHPRSTRRLVEAADLVVVGSQGLLDYARMHNPRAIAVPTAYDPADYPGPAPDAVPVVGWSGTPSNLPFLKDAVPDLLPALQATGSVLRIVTDVSQARRFDWPPGTQLVPWRLNHYRTEIARFHVGVSPMPDLPWTRGKLGFKVIEYHACGVPAVASPVLAKDDVLLHGKTGFLAGTHVEWVEAVTRLLQDAALRARMAEAARAHALRQFALKPVVDRLEDELARVLV